MLAWYYEKWVESPVCAQAEVTNTKPVPPNKAAQVATESAQKDQPEPFRQWDIEESVAAFLENQNAAMGGTVDTCGNQQVVYFCTRFRTR